MEDYRMEEHKQVKIKTENDVQDRFRLMKQDIKRTFYRGPFFSGRLKKVIREYYDDYYIAIQLKPIKEEETLEEMLEEVDNEIRYTHYPIDFTVDTQTYKPARTWWRESIRLMIFLITKTFSLQLRYPINNEQMLTGVETLVN